MSRRQTAEEGLLFDLPLDRPPAAPAPIVEEGQVEEGQVEEGQEEPEQPALPLDDAKPPAAAADSRPIAEAAEDRPPRRGADGKPAAATLWQRAAAGLIDLGVCAAVAGVLLVALLAQGVRPSPADWPAAALFLLTFSFLYAVLPLAFWGRSPGMTLAGVRSTTGDGRPLSFRQAVLHWLGSVLTVALAGLPLLLALGGRSLSDRISGSVTRRHDGAG